eukprot:TRINITY_DN18740_c0_g3_i2.p1 TRINITY_DN18740_c0_g3~~TRINITY_DN18740_c0_g3_i2.p1  ORF type:complete len:113 (-),score=23.64 TRINITY_DN18740_c0_g3_i2:142-480(-)
MSTSSGADGIQKLLQAEQAAQRIVDNARKNKQDKLRQAKSEADKELKIFRAKQEDLYQNKLVEAASSTDSKFEHLAEEAQKAVQDIQEQVSNKKDAVVDMLMKMVTTVKYTH